MVNPDSIEFSFCSGNSLRLAPTYTYIRRALLIHSLKYFFNTSGVPSTYLGIGWILISQSGPCSQGACSRDGAAVESKPRKWTRKLISESNECYEENEGRAVWWRVNQGGTVCTSKDQAVTQVTHRCPSCDATAPFPGARFLPLPHLLPSRDCLQIQLEESKWGSSIIKPNQNAKEQNQCLVEGSGTGPAWSGSLWGSSSSWF